LNVNRQSYNHTNLGK